MNLSILPVYKTKEEQDFRKPYAEGQSAPIICGPYLLPFFFYTANPRPVAAISIDIFNTHDELVLAIPATVDRLNKYFKIIRLTSPDVYLIYFKCEQALESLKVGKYYLHLDLKGAASGQEFFTEVFSVVDTVHETLKLTWWDKENFKTDSGTIIYDGFFRNYIYINNPLGRPDYTYEEETTTRDGIIFPNKIIAKKTYKTNFLATESQLDALQLARLADFKILYDGEKRYNIQDLLLTPTWTNQSNIANVEVTFTTVESVIKKSARSITPFEFADYNIDYNADYYAATK